MNLIGIEMAHGFGDGCFSIPLIEELCKKHNSKAVVAVEKRCSDIYNHVPCVHDTVLIKAMHEGHKAIDAKYQIDEFYQITPHAYFYDFKAKDPNHSLTATTMAIGHFNNIQIDPRPKIYLSEEELYKAEEHILKRKRSPIIAIESEHFSGQSWSNATDFENIIKNNPNAVFLWLSYREPPFEYPNLLHSGIRLSRRECIGLLKFVDLFINVGSGFFCASLSEDVEPKESWMLWTDDLYKYKDSINKSGWIKKATWLDNREQWNELVEKTKL